mgnify:CR=1 FL=1
MVLALQCRRGVGRLVPDVVVPVVGTAVTASQRFERIDGGGSPASAPSTRPPTRRTNSSACARRALADRSAPLSNRNDCSTREAISAPAIPITMPPAIKPESFAEHQVPDVAAVRADRRADRDLPPARGDRQRQDAIDADDRQQRADDRKPDQQLLREDARRQRIGADVVERLRRARRRRSDPRRAARAGSPRWPRADRPPSARRDPSKTRVACQSDRYTSGVGARVRSPVRALPTTPTISVACRSRPLEPELLPIAGVPAK